MLEIRNQSEESNTLQMETKLSGFSRECHAVSLSRVYVAAKIHRKQKTTFSLVCKVTFWPAKPNWTELRCFVLLLKSYSSNPFGMEMSHFIHGHHSTSKEHTQPPVLGWLWFRHKLNKQVGGLAQWATDALHPYCYRRRTLERRTPSIQTDTTDLPERVMVTLRAYFTKCCFTAGTWTETCPTQIHIRAQMLNTVSSRVVGRVASFQDLQ